MKTFVNSLIVVFALAIVSNKAFSGEGPVGHSHSALTEIQASEIATTEIKRLSEAGKISSHWIKIPAQSATQAGKAKDWVVLFSDPASEDPSKKNLYVIVTVAGTIKAVNFKGIQKHSHSHGSGPAHSH
jgi:hypothetical protein